MSTADRPTTEPRPPEVGEFESLHHAVGKALYGWADDEPNAATGAVARMEVAGVVLAVIDWLEARATPAEAAQGAAPRAEGLDPLREAALRVILAQEAVRDAINGLGHPDEPHDSVLGDIRRDPTDEVQIIDTVGDCALCGGMQYGSEDTLNRAFGELRAALGLEVRPWEFPEDAARWLSSLSRASDERVPESEEPRG